LTLGDQLPSSSSELILPEAAFARVLVPVFDHLMKEVYKIIFQFIPRRKHTASMGTKTKRPVPCGEMMATLFLESFENHKNILYVKWAEF
jgi:hypothetical protein